MTDPLAVLRERFIERCREDLAQLRARRAGDDLRPTIHRLAGSAGSFGFPDISALAGAIDLQLADGMTPTPDEYDRLAHALEAAARAGT